MLNKIRKRDGSIEKFNPHKLIKWSEWASKGLNGRVDWFSVAVNAFSSLKDEVIDSSKLQEALISSCLAKGGWSYYLMAGRLYGPHLQKQIFPNGIPDLKSHLEKMYNLDLLKKFKYTDEQIDEISNFIDHDKDYYLAEFQLRYIKSKYALQNRVTKEIYETPQFTYIRLALSFAENEPEELKVQRVKEYYDFLSNQILGVSTPDYVHTGTGKSGTASCCLFVADDNKDSIKAALDIAYHMSAEAAGIGGLMMIRTEGDPVRGGAIQHKGMMSYQRSLGTITKTNTQGGRGSSVTSYCSVYHPEVTLLAQAQGVRTTEDKKLRDLHFCIMYNKLFAKKVQNKEDIFQFTIFSAPDLWQAQFSGNEKLFEDLYNKYEQDPNFKKTYVNSVELLVLIMKQEIEIGTLYSVFIDEINRHTPFLELIYSSNLCVAPYTKILTTKGWEVIKELENKEVEVWNGEEFSKTVVRKTSEKSKLLRVVTDCGYWIDCTPYHKFYIQEDYSLNSIKEVRAHELTPDMKLIKFNLPVIEGTEVLDKAYINGFYTGDGCLTPQGQRVYLYNEKMNLKDLFTGGSKWTDQPNQKRLYKHYNDLEDKFFVPDNEYTIKSRLEWLAGFSDADGCVYENQDCQQLVLSSVNKSFLENTALMLQTLGIFSKIKLNIKEGYRNLPANDGSGLNKPFFCKDSYRLLITGNDLQKLLDLGIVFYRLKVNKRELDRDARQFIKIEQVLLKNRPTATYCFTESKRNMGMFNGILTGNCVEIVEPTYPYSHSKYLYMDGDTGSVKFKATNLSNEEIVKTISYSDPVWLNINDKQKVTYAGSLKIADNVTTNTTEGPLKITEILESIPTSEVALCNLASINVGLIGDDEEKYEKAAYLALKKIDKSIHTTEYALANVGYTAKNRMNAGVGVVGLAYHLAKKGLKYGTLEGRNEIHRVFERHSYYLIKASLKISKERGLAPWIYKTKWPDGWLPIDTYKKSVDELVTVGYQYDWEKLRSEIIANRGIGHSCLVSLMPTESSSKPLGMPNGPYPPRDIELNKTDASIVVEWCAKDSDIYDYQIAYDIDNLEMFKDYAVMQKWCDHSISADGYRNRTKITYINTSTMVEEFLTRCKFGVKSKYYQNSLLNAEEAEEIIGITEDSNNTNIETMSSVIDNNMQNTVNCESGVCKL